MTIKIIPKPPDLTFEFFDLIEKVGICWGLIYENEQEIGFYYANTFFDSKESLELHTALRSVGDKYVVVAAKCDPEQTGKYEIVHPNVLRFEFDTDIFNEYTLVKPENISAYHLAGKACGLMDEVICADPGIYEYLSGNVPPYSVCEIETCGQAGLISPEAYPFNYVIWSLQFLALSAAELKTYLAQDDGKLEVTCERLGNPFEAHLYDCVDWIGRGTLWNDWIYSPNLKDRTIEKEFKSLWDLLEVFCIDFIDEGLFTESMLEDEQSEFMKSYASCRTQAQKLLTKLGWTNKDPIWTSQKLLDDYSWDR